MFFFKWRGGAKEKNDMKVFFAFVKKEFYHIFRDTRTLVVLFGMPLAQVLLFGYAITTEVKNADIVIYNQSPGQFSHQLCDKLISSDFFQLKGNVHSRYDMLEAFKSNRAKLAVIIPPEFEQDYNDGNATIQLIADGSDPNLASILSNSARAVIMSWSFGNITIPIQVETINTNVRWHYNISLKSVYMFVPGVITIILMLVSAMLTSISITREKELGTIEVLNVSPLKPAGIVIGKVVPYLVLSLLNASFILFISWVVFDMPIQGSLWLLMVECLLFIFTALSLGVLISTIASSQQQALMLSLFVLMLPTMLLSGFIFPISSMPIPLRVLSHIIPARYFLTIIRGIMLKGIGIEYLWPQTITLIGITILLISISVKKFKIRLE